MAGGTEVTFGDNEAEQITPDLQELRSMSTPPETRPFEDTLLPDWDGPPIGPPPEGPLDPQPFNPSRDDKEIEP